MPKPKNNELELRQYKSEFKILETKEEGDQGLIEAYVSIFGNVDSYNDIIEKGAFEESLKDKLPKGVWMHNWDEPVAKTLEAKEDNIGLYIKGQFNLETQRGREAFSDLKMGIIDEFSIGFVVKDDSWDDETGIRTIKKIKLYEWSPVLAGANPKTSLIDAKTDEIKKEQEKTPEEKEEKAVVGNIAVNMEKKEMYLADDEGQPVATFKLVDNAYDLIEKIDEAKAGKVLSEKNRKSISTVVDELKSLGNNIDSILNPLEKLLELTDDSKGVKVDTVPQKKKTPTKEILRIRHSAKQAVKANEFILRMTK